MKKNAAALLLLLVAACAQSTSPPQAPAALLSQVNVTDGVSRTEAEKIAEAYFATHIGCGAYSGVTEAGDVWVVEGKHGFAGDPIQNFTISKRSGTIKSSIGPSYEHPEDMLRHAQRGASADRHGSRSVA